MKGRRRLWKGSFWKGSIWKYECCGKALWNAITVEDRKGSHRLRRSNAIKKNEREGATEEDSCGRENLGGRRGG